MASPGAIHLAAKSLQLPLDLQIALQFVAQSLEHPRHGHDHRYALASRNRDDLGRIQGMAEDHGTAQQLRNKDPQKLSEDVAQRQEIEKTEGMKRAGVFEV